MGGSSSAHRQWLIFSGVVLLGLPGIVLFLSGLDPHPLTSTCVYGGAILAGAFVLSWAAEVAELDISASLAIAILALLTVLPEYAIEAVLAWDAGASFDAATRAATEETRRVAANVTGANRLLIGFGWSIVILIFWLRNGGESLTFAAGLGAEMTFLAVAVFLTCRYLLSRGDSPADGRSTDRSVCGLSVGRVEERRGGAGADRDSGLAGIVAGEVEANGCRAAIHLRHGRHTRSCRAFCREPDRNGTAPGGLMNSS